MTKNTLILDNGGYTIKLGYSNKNEIKRIPNCVTKVKSERRRLFIGDEIDECKDFTGAFYLLPISRGYLSNFDVQRQVWDYLFKNKCKWQDDDHSLILTQPYFNFRQIQEYLIEVMFEEYNVDKLLIANPSYFSMIKHCKGDLDNGCCLIVDSGYSFTHIIPYINGKQVKYATKRIDVGGKALTNYLKDVISYRQLHVLDETHVMNQCKEDCCYVAEDFMKELEICKEKKNSIARDYVLPDFVTYKRGFVREDHPERPVNDQQIIKLNNERLQTPEILFYPSDVGINQIGISHCIHHCIESLPDEFRPILYANIVLIGGNACFAGMKDRIGKDLRSLSDRLFDVEVHLPANPIDDAVEGARYLCKERSDLLSKLFCSKSEYSSKGVQSIVDKFSNY